MKKIIFMTLVLVSGILSAATQYEFIYGSISSPGYIQITQDLTSFSFATDFGSVGNAGSLGFYTFTDDPANRVDGGTTFRKANGSTVALGSFTEGQKIGFYLTRNNGTILTDFYFTEEGGNIYLNFVKTGNGKDEILLFGSIIAGGDTPAPSGQPLPGVLAAMILGGGAAYSAYRRKRQ